MVGVGSIEFNSLGGDDDDDDDCDSNLHTNRRITIGGRSCLFIDEFSSIRLRIHEASKTAF